MDIRISGKSCTKKKRETKRMYRKWRRGKRTKVDFIESRKKLREFLEQKKKEKQEEAKLRNIKKELEIWRYINKKKKREEWTKNNIEKEEWKKNFIRILGGRKENAKKTRCAKTEMQGEEEKDFKKEEIGEAVMKIKQKEAAGIDKIPAETWKFGGEALKKTIDGDFEECLEREIYTRGMCVEKRA